MLQRRRISSQEHCAPARPPRVSGTSGVMQLPKCCPAGAMQLFLFLVSHLRSPSTMRISVLLFGVQTWSEVNASFVGNFWQGFALS